MKSPYKNVLVAVPPPAHEWYKLPADSLRNAAAAISLVPGVHLTFLSVYSSIVEIGSGEVNLLPPEVYLELNEERERKLKEDVAQYVKWFTDNGVQCAVRVERDDDPAAAVVRISSAIKADLILLGYHHDEGLFDLFIPDVARRVAKKAPCDVLLIAPAKK